MICTNIELSIMEIVFKFLQSTVNSVRFFLRDWPLLLTFTKFVRKKIGWFFSLFMWPAWPNQFYPTFLLAHFTVHNWQILSA